MWSERYADARCDARFLLSLPALMLQELHALAASRDVSVAELLRQLASIELAKRQ